MVVIFTAVVITSEEIKENNETGQKPGIFFFYQERDTAPCSQKLNRCVNVSRGLQGGIHVQTAYCRELGHVTCVKDTVTPCLS